VTKRWSTADDSGWQQKRKTVDRDGQPQNWYQLKNENRALSLSLSLLFIKET